eukprot:scaffold733_cov52-Phaeocystis_antarctica.AAC.4
MWASGKGSGPARWRGGCGGLPLGANGPGRMPDGSAGRIAAGGGLNCTGAVAGLVAVVRVAVVARVAAVVARVAGRCSGGIGRGCGR